MKLRKVKDAERYGLNCLEKWNDVTGAVDKNSGWYLELQSLVEDAVHIGIQMALFGKVKTNSRGEIVRNDENMPKWKAYMINGEGKVKPINC